MLNKDKTVERVQVVVRVNNDIGKGIEYVGRMALDPMYTQKDRGMLVVDSEGTILELNKTASSLFQRDKLLSSYNPEFQTYISEFNRASSFKSNNPRFSFNKVFASENSLKNFKHYTSLTSGIKLTVHDRSCDSIVL